MVGGHTVATAVNVVLATASAAAGAWEMANEASRARAAQPAREAVAATAMVARAREVRAAAEAAVWEGVAVGRVAGAWAATPGR